MRSASLLLLGSALLLASPAPSAAEGELEVRRDRVVRAVDRARSSVVSIRTNEVVSRIWYDLPGLRVPRDTFERDGGLGSGVIFHPAGFVITNAHVIARASRIFVSIPGTNGEPPAERRALPQAVDIPNDLAILRIMPNPGDVRRYPALPLGRSNDLMVGESIIAIGHPFRLGLTVTTGIISGLNRSLRLRKHKFNDFLQVDAAINPGNSGGPLLDITGRWVGVNTAIYNRAQGAEGIGFAIPADRVRSLVARAFKRRLMARDWLGIEMDETSEGEGRIAHIYPTGPAAGAALRVGDEILAVNGRDAPTLFDARLTLLEVPERSSVDLRVRRNESIVSARVALQPLPTDNLSNRRLGFVASDTDAFDGVRVDSVRPGSPGDKIGLRRHDVIVALGGRKIRNTDDLLIFLQFVSKGDVVKVRVKGTSRIRDWRPGVIGGDFHGQLIAQ